MDGRASLGCQSGLRGRLRSGLRDWLKSGLRGGLRGGLRSQLRAWDKANTTIIPIKETVVVFAFVSALNLKYFIDLMTYLLQLPNYSER